VISFAKQYPGEPMRSVTMELHGKVLNVKRFAGLVLSETQYASRLRLPPHVHQHPYFSFVLSGSYREEHEGKTRYCDPRTLAFHPAGERHHDIFLASGCRCFNIQIGEAMFRRSFPRNIRFDVPAVCQRGLATKAAARLFREFCHSDELSGLVVEGLILEMVAEIARQGAPEARRMPSWLVRCRDLLRERFRDSLTLDEVATAVGVHPVHVAKYFRRHYGYTVGEFIRELRVRFAQQELSNSTSPLADIAHAAGFCDQSHFCRTFRCWTGLTPSQYRGRYTC
jgi:AraC family transcriptional regulator